LDRYGQEHLLDHWDNLNEAEKKNLYNEIKVIGVARWHHVIPFF
jgi:hypothetical protein